MRFSKVIAVTLAAGPAGALAAYEKARSSFAPQPPQPDFGQVVEWAATGNDWVALGTIALAAVSTGYSIYQMFQPDPATQKDVAKDGRKTREGLEHLSRHGAAEGRASEERDKLTHRLVSGELHERVEAAVDADAMTGDQLTRIYAKVAEKLGVEAAPAATQNIVEAAGRSSNEVQDLLAAGKFVEAGVAQQRLAEAGDAKQAQRWRDTARIKVLTSIKEAITAYARAIDLDSSDFRTWIELSRLHRAAGSLPQARQTAERALQHVGDDWDRMVAENTLGDIAVAEGQLPAARRHYQAGLIAANAVLAADPDDNDRQREVSVSHEKLGDVAVAEGDLAGARTAYGAGLAISERLAASDPGNAEWQRDLSVSHDRLGDVAVAEGDLAGARAAYGAGLVIRERLASSDPGNVGWQRDLSVSHDMLGNVAVAQGDLAGARAAYAAGLVIAERLAASDPGNAEWQRDLSVSHEKLGDVARAEGDLAGARAAYSAGLVICERLAASDPGNAGWQRDGFISHAKFAQFNEASGDVAGAIREFEAGEAILVALIARVGDHPGYARDLAQVRGDIARLRGG
ncbi:MAG: hypothetical protein AABY88_02765 [Pseudomonadota bacterium]